MRQSILICLLLVPVLLVAQDYAGFHEKSLSINQTGMYVLGGWAIANVITGAYGWNRYDGQRKYFHQMNLFWNGINLTIAGFGLYGSLHSGISLSDAGAIMEAHVKTERIFLINAGLDVLYVAGGLYLTNLSQRKTEKRFLFKGYGNSVILQGSFLLAFDLIMYFVQHGHRNGFMAALTHLQFSPHSLSVGFQF